MYDIAYYMPGGQTMLIESKEHFVTSQCLMLISFILVTFGTQQFLGRLPPGVSHPDHKTGDYGKGITVF